MSSLKTHAEHRRKLFSFSHKMFLIANWCLEEENGKFRAREIDVTCKRAKLTFAVVVNLLWKQFFLY